MNRLAQFSLILGILFLGEFLQLKFDLSIPSTIIGMIILLILMIIRVIKLEWVENIGDTLLNSLSLLFIPAGVAIMTELNLFKGNIFKLSVIILVSTILVILVTAYTIQYLENRKRGRSI